MRIALSRPEMFAAAAPICPKCSKAMTPRAAKQAAGGEYRFWGCVAFPGCLGTRPMK
jgi:ssDNA-binding Zn-finger/Zn-ribbon topoisomerase 1